MDDDTILIPADVEHYTIANKIRTRKRLPQFGQISRRDLIQFRIELGQSLLRLRMLGPKLAKRPTANYPHSLTIQLYESASRIRSPSTTRYYIMLYPSRNYFILQYSRRFINAAVSVLHKTTQPDARLLTAAQANHAHTPSRTSSRKTRRPYRRNRTAHVSRAHGSAISPSGHGYA